MSTLGRAPTGALAPFVARLWVHRGSVPAAVERILPSGAMQLLVNLADDELRSLCDGRLTRVRGAAIGGMFDRSQHIDTHQQRFIAGVAFRPGGAWPFVRVPCDALANQHVELDQLWGPGGRTVRERLIGAGSLAGIVDALEAILLEQLREADPDPVIDFAVRVLGRGWSVAEVSDRSGLSERQLLRRFTARVGVAPKRFARIERFQRLLRAAGPAPDWAELAVRCGYVDQAHLGHEFRALAGIPPSGWQPRAPGDRNHVPDPIATETYNRAAAQRGIWGR